MAPDDGTTGDAAHPDLVALGRAVPDMLIVYAADGRLVHVNDLVVQRFGYATRAEALAAPPDAHAGARMDVAEAAARVARAAAGVAQDFLWTCRDRAGVEFPCEVRLRRFSVRGDPLVLAFLRDRTEQVRAEDALRDSERRYRAMFERNQAVKWILDPADGRILDVNDACAAFYGWTREQMLRMRVTDINTAAPDEVKAQMARAKTEERVHFEFRHRKADGTVVDVEVHSGPIELDGRTVLLSIIHDISAKRRMEEQLRTAAKMEALGRLAGGIAHDFNNLMTVVVGNSALALKELPPDSPVRAYVADVAAAGSRAARVTRQLLAVGRRQVLTPRVLDLNRVVADAVAMLRHAVPATTELALDLRAEPALVRADADQLEQVILNLVLNARDAVSGRPRGRVVLRTSAILQGDERRPHVRLCVEDDGVGIPASSLPHVFEPFWSTKGGEDGSGLGLATVYGIVHQSGGRVSVQSVVGVGTTFCVELPAAGADDRTPAPLRREGSGGGETVLVVDDDALVLRLAGLMLRAEGYRVLAAGGAAEARATAAAHDGPIHLLLTDVQMPDERGDALADALRAQRPGLRVLFMSGYAFDAALPDRVVDGATEFLPKPLTPETLAAKVRALLDASR